jgi:hypothetical protein
MDFTALVTPKTSARELRAYARYYNVYASDDLRNRNNKEHLVNRINFAIIHAKETTTEEMVKSVPPSPEYLYIKLDFAATTVKARLLYNGKVITVNKPYTGKLPLDVFNYDATLDFGVRFKPAAEFKRMNEYFYRIEVERV